MMKKYVVLIVFFFSLGGTNAQEDVVTGKDFEFDAEMEKDPQIFLVDAYNHYLFSIVNEWSAVGSKLIIARKFDQSNSMVERIAQDFTLSNDMLHRYGGMYEVPNNKVVVFIQSYSKKTLKSDIYMYVFDKSTDKFTSKVVASYRFQSVSKSGTIETSKSKNGKFISVVHVGHRDKNTPEPVEFILFNTATLEPVFKTVHHFDDDYISADNITTNSGKIVVVRNPKSYKQTKYLAVVDSKGSEKKYFEEKVQIHKPVAISINDQDYLLAFNFINKTVQAGGEYNNILLYDLAQGKTLFNNKIAEYKEIAGVKSIDFVESSVDQNHIYVFTELKREEAHRQRNANAGMMLATGMTDEYYGPNYFYAFNHSGELLKSINLEVRERTRVNPFHSFGVINVQGEFFVNSNDHPKRINPFEEFKVTGYVVAWTGYSRPSRAPNLVYFNSANNRFIVAELPRDNNMRFMSAPRRE